MNRWSADDRTRVGPPTRATSLWVAAAAGLVALAAGFPGLDEMGVTWDEPRYFQSVERIQKWTDRVLSAEWRTALGARSIQDAWDADRYHNPHPPVYKIGMAVTDGFFGDILGTPAGYRLSSLLLFALLVILATAWTSRFTSPGAGLVAGLSIVGMPRLLGHAHIAATDVPLMFFWFAATAGFVTFVQGGRRQWLLLAIVSYGLAMATKFTGFLLPIPLLAWTAIYGRSRRAAFGLALGVPAALLVAIAANPAAWPDPVGYQVRLIADSLSRDVVVPISTHYRGVSFGYVVPWDHAIVLTIVTIPVGILGLAAVGMKASISQERLRPIVVLCLVQVMFWFGLLGLPGSPNHDGVRLWLPMFPFIAVAAGLGAWSLGEAVERRCAEIPARLAKAGLLILYFAPAMLGSWRAAPAFLSYYGEFIGGLSGAERRGMEVSYWFDAVTAEFRDSLNSVLPDSARVVAHPNYAYYRQLQELGLLREDIVFTNEPPGEYLLLLSRKASFNEEWNRIYREGRPLVAIRHDDVVLVGLYEGGNSAP